MLQASWGVTVVPPDRITLSFEDLIEETDDRLYEEKQRRREAGLR
jgi:GGDEF domain-containing protein